MRLIFSLVLTTGCLLSTIYALRPSRLWASSPPRPCLRTAAVKPGSVWNAVNTKPVTTTALAVAGGAVESNEEWTKKRLHNTAAFRSAALLLALAAAGASSSNVAAPVSLLPATVAASIHVLSFATWLGTVAYTTFVAGITMFQNLPRQTFGRLQAKLFPKYFSLSSAAIVLQLVTLKTLSIVSKCKSTKALAVALAMTLVNQFYLEPVSTNNMMERYRLDDTPGGKDTDEYKKLKASFGKFHGLSSLTNLVALCAGVAHGVFLASGLV